MATTVFDLQAVLGLDTSKYESGLKGAEGMASKFGNGLATAAKVGVAAVTAATGAAVAFSKTAIDSAISYETAFTGVMKTVEETGTTSYEKLSDDIKKMATETASSQEAIAGVMEAAGQLGISADDITGFTKTMVMLGDTTNLSADEAAIALAHFTNITGESNQNIDKLGAAIVDLGNNFATDEASIVSMSTRLASAGTLAGLTSTDILGLSTAMSSVGIQAEMGGTAMTQILTKMSNAVMDGSDKMDTFAKVSGMSSEEFAKAWKDKPTSALSAFVRGLSEAADSGQNTNHILEELGIKGIREANTVRSLALACDVLDDAVDTANTAFEENTALTAEAEKRYGTTESKIIQMKNAFKNLKIAVGDELKPELGEFIDFAKNGFISLTDAFEKGGIQGAIDELGNLFTEGTKILTDKLPEFIKCGIGIVEAIGEGIMNNLPAITTAAVDIIGQLGQAFVDNLPSIIDAGLTILEALLKAFGNNVDKILKAGRTLIEGIVNAIGKHSKSIGEAALFIIETLFNALIDNLPKIMEFATELIVGFAEFVSNNADKVVDSAIALIEALSKGLQDNLPKIINAAIEIVMSLAKALTDPENLNTILTSAVNIIIALADGLIQNLPTLIPAVVDIILNIAETLTNPDNLVKIIECALELIVALAEGLINALPKLIEKAPVIIENLVEAIVRLLPKIIEMGGRLIVELVTGIIGNLPKIISSGKQIIDALGQGIANMFLTLVANGGKIMDKIKEGIDKINVADWAKDMIKGFVDGMTGGQAMQWLREGAATVAQKIKDFLGFSEPDEGPLSNFHTFAPDMMQLYAQGIRNNLGLVEDAVNATADAIETDFSISPNANMNVSNGSKVSNNQTTFNIYASEGQDVNELAEIINEKLSHMLEREEAVYA